VGAGWTVVWLLLQLRQWWLPYLLGPTPLHRDFRWYWEGGYAETLRLLPARGWRPVADLQHLVLQLLSLAAAAYGASGGAPVVACEGCRLTRACSRRARRVSGC
jgi:hypothetical protein